MHQAERHNQRIAASEIAAVDDYWLLGRVLERMRDNFRRGTWQPWLDRRKIDLTRAKRARLLAQTFASAEELSGLSIHAALRIARLRKRANATAPEPDLAKQLKSALKKLRAIANALDADDSPVRFAPLAHEVAAAAAAICRACHSPSAEGPR